MAEGGDELVNNLEENQNLKNSQGKMLHCLNMGLPELPVAHTSSSGSYITYNIYSVKSSTDLKGPLQDAPPLSPVPQVAQDPQVTSTTERDLDYSKGSEEHKLTGQRYQSAQPDSTYCENGTYSASKTSLRSCSPEDVCSESQQFLPSSSNLQAQTCLSSPHESLRSPSCSQPNDLNVVSSPQPTPGSGSNMTFPAFYSPFMQPGSAPGVSWLPYCAPVWFPPTTMVPGPQGVSINPYMPPFGSGGMPSSPYFYPPCVPPAATPGPSSVGNGSSSSSESENEPTSLKYGMKINDETRITSLPFPMIRWISMKMDDTYAEKNWQDVADRHGWIYEKINEHKQQCCNFQRSFFEWMLKKDTFSTYTVGKFKADMKAIRRMDVYEDFDGELNKHLMK
ncbi:hypothetical protein C0Q70_13450 [Pomacea canaliculata]|uniref:Uncharacterized protein n=1 Tax=Pomacea canaliculata TaxID=400727 RepID=A0A2T7NX91_POMCA|nr:uncharacterized protein LOC112570985 [Pomacea canaliculata]PVD25790.1 hypothetical protein C0Q70_13450 [Pomacea canaliculata]